MNTQSVENSPEKKQPITGSFKQRNVVYKPESKN